MVIGPVSSLVVTFVSFHDMWAGVGADTKCLRIAGRTDGRHDDVVGEVAALLPRQQHRWRVGPAAMSGPAVRPAASIATTATRRERPAAAPRPGFLMLY